MTYATNPVNDLLDVVKEVLKLSTDKQLAQAMRITTGNMSKVRHQNAKFGPAYQLKVLTLTGWTVAQMKQKMGAQCKETSTS